MDILYDLDTCSELLNNFEFPRELTELYTYFSNSYIGDDLNARFPIDLRTVPQSHMDEISGTNNATESCHRVFITIFGASRNILPLLNCKVMDGEELIRQRAIRFSSGEYPRKRTQFTRVETDNNNCLNSYRIEGGLEFIFTTCETLYY